MSLLQQIQADSLAARKNRETDKATLLVTLYSEAANVGKNSGNRLTTDTETVAVIKKFLKGIEETIEVTKSDQTSNRYQIALDEKVILEKYLPKQLTSDELRVIITAYVETLPDKSPKQIGVVSKFLKENYSGQYDGSVGASIIKERLA